jgi:MFS family permease
MVTTDNIISTQQSKSAAIRIQKLLALEKVVSELNPNARTAQGLRAVPRGVWALGFVSMFMDISSEMIHSLLPIFLVSVLGAGATAVGALEGIAEATVLVTKMFSGFLSDWLGKRKFLALVGYGMAALTKPLFPLAGSYFVVLVARLIDRVGKGVREAPRDALIADLVPGPNRGASYGLRQSLDTVGAVGGPLAASFLMLTSGGSFRYVFWIAVLPAFLAFVVLAVFVHDEPYTPSKPPMLGRPLGWQAFRDFRSAFWSVVGIGAIFTLARFSEAFLVLRAGNLGLKTAYVPLVMVVMNVVYAASAYPAGRLSDQVDRRLLLAVSAAVLATADVLLAAATGVVWLIGGIALWGLSLGLSQGLFAALLANAAPVDRRGTAFGLFNLVNGGALLISGVVAGELWDQIGPPAPFYAGAGVAGLALLGLIWQMRAGLQSRSGRYR